ncbi:MAG: TIGR01906 family membrane protein [Marinisporobacter sp.]|nr:TIGR01906 family membrane protein [Marinisporobacter sp.]
MKKKKYFCRISQGLIIISLPIVLLLTILQAYALDKDFYLKEFEKYHIEENTKIEKKELSKIVGKIIDYLKNEEGNINIHAKINEQDKEVFGNREKLHMVDVKKLFQKGYNLQKIGIFFIGMSLIVLMKKSEKIEKDIYRSLKGASILSLGSITILFILIQINFYKYFTYFHKLLFNNDLWLLNPKTDILIQMLPLGFFNDIAKKTIVWFVGIMVILGGIACHKGKGIREK